MEKKIKISTEEEKVLRLSIPTDNGMVVVNNPSEKFKRELLIMLVNCLTKGEDFDEKKIMLDLIDNCTNVEFVGDVFETEYLSHEAKMIINEIFLIFQELVQEAYQILKLAMQQAKNEMEQNNILKEKDEIVEVVKEKDEIVEVVKEKDVVDENTQRKIVKKPQRGRKRR